MTVASSHGVEIAVHDLGGHGPVLLISHATGFHGRAYLPLAAELRDDYHCIAFDYRGHGDTPLPTGDPIEWQRYGDDAEAMARSLAGPIVAFGHSMGGATLLMAAHRDPSLFSHLVLFEPIVFPTDARRPGSGEGPNAMIEGARRRRATFPSYEAAIANYASKPPLSAFTPAALDDYVRFGFWQDAAGAVHLKCSPDTEADTFSMGAQHGTWDVLPEIQVPVLVIAGRADGMGPAMVAPLVAERLPNGRFLEDLHVDHFGPMTHPAELAAIIRNELA